MKILIAVTHLLGTGHLARAGKLADAFCEAGHEAHVLSGGFPAPNATPKLASVAQAPAVRSNGVDFKNLLTPSGAPVDEAYREQRAQMMVETLRRLRPDVLITELFPFGRRGLRTEFLALLRAAHEMRPRPMICTSVRDVLEPPTSEERARQCQEWCETLFDHMLIHSDPGLIRLEETWPLSAKMRQQALYTGYVVAPPSDVTPLEGLGDILVTAGGGPVGALLFDAAAQAAGLASDLPTWRLFVGGGPSQAQLEALREKCARPERLVVSPANQEFKQLLPHAGLWIGQSGYNTMLEVAAARVPAVIAPFSEGGETEQTFRAEKFAARYGYEIRPEDGLTPETLVAAARRQIKRAALQAPAPLMDGAQETARLITEAHRAFRG